MWRIETRRLTAGAIGHAIFWEVYEKLIQVIQTQGVQFSREPRAKIKITSIREYLNYFQKLGYQGLNDCDDRSNFFRAQWGESKPVLHLSMALVAAGYYSPFRPLRSFPVRRIGTLTRIPATGFQVTPPIQSRSIPINAFELIGKPQWVLPAVQMAENLRTHHLPRLISNYDLSKTVCLAPKPSA
jgi:hypothetical protein